MNIHHTNTALLLAPHPDDVEFACGGTIKKLIESDCTIHYAGFSPCKKSMPEDQDLFEELYTSCKLLGIKEQNIYTFNFPVREFPANRQAILEELIKMRNNIKPELIFIPCSTDIHQDHQVIYNEGLRAFKHMRILGYELPWNSVNSPINFFVEISDEQLKVKINSIKAYKSQEFRSYSDPEIFISLAKLRGLQAGVPLAEGFECIRWIG